MMTLIRIDFVDIFAIKLNKNHFQQLMAEFWESLINFGKDGIDCWIDWVCVCEWAK